MVTLSSTKHLEIFFCHADEDQELCTKLEKHLSFLKQFLDFTIWSKRSIISGGMQEKEVEKHLKSANLILLMVSVHLISIEENYAEMLLALKRHTTQEARVVSVLLQPVGHPQTGSSRQS